MPLTVGEYEEWGNPKIAGRVPREMQSYSPYDNLEAQAYPAMLVRTSLQRQPGHVLGAGQVRRPLRTVKTDENPLLFKVNMAAGHGGSSGRYDRLKETAFDYAFLFREVGIAK